MEIFGRNRPVQLLLQRRGLLFFPFVLQAGNLVLDQVIGAIALLARTVIDHRIGKRADVSGSLPHARMHQNRGVQPLDVVAERHFAPPRFLHIAQQFHAQRAVIPATVESAVNIGRLKDEPAAFREGDDRIERDR